MKCYMKCYLNKLHQVIKVYFIIDCKSFFAAVFDAIILTTAMETTPVKHSSMKPTKELHAYLTHKV